MKKSICYLLIVVLLSTPIPVAHSISVKTRGKLTLVAILSGVAIFTKYLVGRDRQTVEKLHARLGEPDRVLEYERGFDRWRIEWYGDRKYRFRNHVLQKSEAPAFQRLCPLKGPWTPISPPVPH